ncbi:MULTISPECIES: DUF2157 domain-containing protein [Moorena]|uniref:Putative membrane protein n=1 Tax=Moorena producens 3L TaxID=489825 RepID=F4XS63_9CYAN|nr:MULTISPECIES: DUF2157 domain-containing protein [Moorena]EGJ32585.1 putative membrane protein [Moorena producens 3L]NEP31876.1 DUF2157 domain-containing protein [Moorena sp. SIO3B2]NEP67094.1 DUF2157 domain-containing protein [Moorena sp. SIO3A5]NEQ08444.1 DUF2157 domain-containing protein [Moorena sp. SIO4E2]NER88809.1 DUF2157 domain-containing protein [Moorena sp. SIO3A2]
MPSDKFRHQLRLEAQQWQTEGLIDAGLYAQLAERYQFSDLEVAARNRFVVILLVLGSLLLGLGMITFVAANWQAWSRWLKVTLLLSVFFGINIAGFYLWRDPTQGRHCRLGQGLLLLGALTLGANIALMSQMFHHSGPLYQLYLIWGLGVLAMAYSLRLTRLGMLAMVLIGLGYVRGISQPEFLAITELSWLRLIIQHMPVFAGLLFIPLAYWCRSRWMFRLSAIAVVAGLEWNLINFELWPYPGWIAAIACALPPALLWSYGDFLGTIQPNLQEFNCTARTLGITFLSLSFYFLSFHVLWDSSPSVKPLVDVTSILLEPAVIDSVILGSLTIWAWIKLLRRVDSTTKVVATMIVISALVPYWHLSIGILPILAVFIFNLLLFLIVIGLIRAGLAEGKRGLFWGGMVLLTLQILTRMLEYDTGLLVKSIVLFLCGLGIIGAGLWFERYLKSEL